MSAKQNEPAASSGELVPVKFSRLTRRGILLGLSLSQLITLAIGILSIVGALYAGGGLLLAYTAPVWVIAACLTWIPVAGRPAVEWLPVAVWWLWRTTGDSSSTGAESSSPARSGRWHCPATRRGCGSTPTPKPRLG